MERDIKNKTKILINNNSRTRKIDKKQLFRTFSTVPLVKKVVENEFWKNKINNNSTFAKKTFL